MGGKRVFVEEKTSGDDEAAAPAAPLRASQAAKPAGKASGRYLLHGSISACRRRPHFFFFPARAPSRVVRRRPKEGRREASGGAATTRRLVLGGKSMASAFGSLDVKERLNAMTEVVTFGAYEEFPIQSVGLQVFDPESKGYAYWEALLAPFIAYAAIVTPTELAFYGDDDGWRCFGENCSAGTLLLFFANRFVDLYFLLDMVVVFNTAVFDPKLNRWILDRRKIAHNYLRGWLTLDVLSILPYDVLNAKSLNSLRLLRTLKVLRLLKLLRVARVGRVLRTWAPRLHMSFKHVAVMRASLLIVVVLHWLACSCRMVLGPCFTRPSSQPACLTDYMIIVKGKGVTTEYFSALHWAMRALTGDADAPILGVMVLAVVAGLLGTIVTSFMIGEIAAILGNNDPASIVLSPASP